MRSATFDVDVGAGLIGPWTWVVTGANSAGNTLALETHDFTDPAPICASPATETARTTGTITKADPWGRN